MKTKLSIRIVTILICAAIMISAIMPITVFASSLYTSMEYGVENTLSGEQQSAHVVRTAQLDLRDMPTSSNISEGWSWDNATKTLTLNGVNFASDAAFPLVVDTATIILNGDNRIISEYYNTKSGSTGNTSSAGVYSDYGDITIEGDGSLTVQGGTAFGDSAGILTIRGSLTVNGGYISATGGTSARYDSYGIRARSVTLNGGSLVATGGHGYNQSPGLETVDGDIEINDGYLKTCSGTIPETTEWKAGLAAILCFGGKITVSERETINEPDQYSIGIVDGYSPICETVLDSNGKYAKTVVCDKKYNAETPRAAKITGLSPASGTKNFDITTGEEIGFYIKFDKPIASNDGQPYQAKVDLKNSGAFAIYRASDDQLVYKPSQYASFDFGLNTDKTQLGVHPVNIRTILDPATEYYITMGSDFVKFENGVTSPAIQKGEWTFTTAGEAQKSLTLSLSRSSSDITARSTAKNTATTNQAGAKITWKSSNPSVATATQNGNSVTVTGVAAGNATITATATWNGQTVSANWKVTVYSNLKVSLKDKKIYLDKGQSANLVYNCSPAGGKATFQVADSSVVSVSANGKVTGLKVGTTTVQVTYMVGAGQVTDICTVQVVEDEKEKIEAFVQEAKRHKGQNKIQFMKSVGATSLPSQWCADFVTQCAKVCGLDDIIPTGSNPFVESKGMGVLFTDITVHNNKSFQEKYRKFFDKADLMDREAYEPQVGDIVFFRQDEKSNPNTLFSHTGIVYKLDATHIYVVHGNWGGKVEKTRSGFDKFTYTSERDGKQHTEYVVGYFHPDWSASTGVKDGTSKGSIHCPVEVLVSYDHESLDSATEQLSASYGSMTLGSDESVSYTIDNYYDTHVTINGTGTGTMDADFTYTDDNGTVATRSFRGVPITEDTVIDVIESHDTSGGVTLIVYEGQTFREAWYANDNIAVSSPDKYATEWFSQGNEDNEEHVRNFTDVSPNSWYTEAVNYVVEHGYMYGESDTTFAPLGSTLRGTVVTILHNTEQKPTPAGGNPFSDVKDGAWYDLPIRWAVENGVAAGRGNGIFSPEMQVTREELAVFLYNFSTNYKKHAPTNFADFSQATDSAQVSSWAKTAMEWAVGNGIIHGTSTTSLTLDPKGTANRAQVAMMIKNLFENVLTE